MSGKKDKVPTITILRKRVGENVELVNIPNVLGAMQEEIGGYIQAVLLSNNITLICDEEGKLKGKHVNFLLPWGDPVVGDVFFVKDYGGAKWGDMVTTDKDRLCESLGFLPSH